jgi:peptidoglycan/xylan/chitin deacetylase (PgdA/CDA1 family)
MSAARRQLLVGLLAIPLSLLPFLAYGTWTSEGRLLTDRIQIRFDPPTLPELDDATRRELQAVAPAYEGRVMPLVYHGVGSEGSGEGGHVIAPERFAEQLAALKAAGMRFVTAADVAEAFGGGDPLPPNAVLVTFDDGRSDAVLWATRLLEQAEARATMFVITDATERPGAYYAGWDALLESGVWDLQSHTADLHEEQPTEDGPLPALVSRAEGERLDEWRARVRADLDRADAALREHAGRDPVAFAYPFGAWGAEDRTNDPAIALDLLYELGQRYRLAFHQDEQETVPLAGPETFPFQIRRLGVGDWDGVELVRHIAAAAARTPGVGPPP